MVGYYESGRQFDEVWDFSHRVAMVYAAEGKNPPTWWELKLNEEWNPEKSGVEWTCTQQMWSWIDLNHLKSYNLINKYREVESLRIDIFTSNGNGPKTSGTKHGLCIRVAHVKIMPWPFFPNVPFRSFGSFSGALLKIRCPNAYPWKVRIWCRW